MKYACIFSLVFSGMASLGFCEQPAEEVLPEVAEEIVAPEEVKDDNIVSSEEPLSESAQGAFFGFQ